MPFDFGVVVSERCGLPGCHGRKRADSIMAHLPHVAARNTADRRDEPVASGLEENSVEPENDVQLAASVAKPKCLRKLMIAVNVLMWLLIAAAIRWLFF